MNSEKNHTFSSSPLKQFKPRKYVGCCQDDVNDSDMWLQCFCWCATDYGQIAAWRSWFWAVAGCKEPWAGQTEASLALRPGALCGVTPVVLPACAQLKRGMGKWESRSVVPVRTGCVNFRVQLGVLLSSYLPRSSFPVPIASCSGFAPVDAAGFWESGFVVLFSCVFFSQTLSVEKKQHINRSIYVTLNTAVLDSRWCVCVFFF